MKALRNALIPGETRSRQFVALVCLALFLALELFSSDPALHKLIHPDANSTGHHCAITLFSYGNISAADTSAAIVVLVAALFFSVPILESAIFSRFDDRLSPSRAPPAA